MMNERMEEAVSRRRRRFRPSSGLTRPSADESVGHDADGNLIGDGLVAADFDHDGDVDLGDFGHFNACFNGPNQPPKRWDCAEADADDDNDVDLTDFQLFQGCYNGPNQPASCPNGLTAMRYTWDAENRLTRAEPIFPAAGDKKTEFRYDYRNRRVRKQVFARNAQNTAWETTPETDLRFVYDGWNVVLVVNSAGTPQKKYTWGLDISGLAGASSSNLPPLEGGFRGVHGAGGIGGLRAVEETATTNGPSYWFLYDANGNVAQILATTVDGPDAIHGVASTPAARYEYDPYGNVIGPDPDGDGDWQEHAKAYALANPIRFSTKWFDAETGLGYWGERYYSPRLGRWMSRDPIGEAGGRNLYTDARNHLPDLVDPWGAQATQPTSRSAPCPWPPYPSDPQPGPDGTPAFEAPKEITMWGPWLRWLIAHEGDHIIISPRSGFGQYVLGLQTTALLEQDARQSIISKLTAGCACSGASSNPYHVFVQTGDFH